MIDYEKCTGCRLCELVCAVKHDGISNPARSRIRVMKWEMEGSVCSHGLPAMPGCALHERLPGEAISRNEELEPREVDYDMCIGCRTCVSVCPFGAMNYNAHRQKGDQVRPVRRRPAVCPVLRCQSH